MFSYYKQNKILPFQRLCAGFTAMFFSTSLICSPTLGYTQTVLNLPTPGTMIALSPSYTPAIMAGMTLYPHDPLKFDFMIDIGDDHLQDDDLKKESQKLISYFMAALTVPEDKMWVNLSPYEKDRIMADGLGQTVLGQDMLAQDYILKQLTASMMYPDGETGKEFWQKVYQTSKEKFGTTDIPTDTFNKIWIVPDRAVVYTKDANVFVADSHLKVMLEEDYLALQHHDKGLDPKADHVKITEETNIILREIVIPQIEKEVNEGKNFANLRQIYHALILATWYKTNLKESLLGQVYVNQNKIQGVETQDKDIKLKIYNQYLEAFKKGSYDYIKEDYDPESQQVISRKYFSGGEDFAALVTSDAASLSRDSWLLERSKVRVAIRSHLNQSNDSDAAMLKEDDDDPIGVEEIIKLQANQGQIWEEKFSTDLPTIEKLVPNELARQVVSDYEGKGRKNILDMGFDSGNDTIFFAQNGHHVVAVDFLQKAIERLTPLIKKLNLGNDVSLSLLDLLSEQWPAVENKKFDVVYWHLGFHQFSHVQLTQIIERLSNYLNPGGRIYMLAKSENDPWIVDSSLGENGGRSIGNTAVVDGRGQLYFKYSERSFKALIDPQQLNIINFQVNDQELRGAKMNVLQAVLQKPENTGGIDFNANNLNLKSSGDKIKFDLPENLQDIKLASINGVTPVIMNISPIANFHLLIGLSDKEENKILTAQRG